MKSTTLLYIINFSCDDAIYVTSSAIFEFKRGEYPRDTQRPGKEILEARIPGVTSPLVVEWGCLVEGRHVGDVVPGVAVQGLLETLLVEVVAHQADGAAQHEQRVDGAHRDVVVALLPGNKN